MHAQTTLKHNPLVLHTNLLHLSINQTLLLFWDYVHKTRAGAENNKQIQNKTEHRGLILIQHIFGIKTQTRIHFTHNKN